VHYELPESDTGDAAGTLGGREADVNCNLTPASTTFTAVFPAEWHMFGNVAHLLAYRGGIWFV